MCGLFGLLRAPGAAHRERASAAFVLLGVLAEERGTDAAGAALLHARSQAVPVPEGCARFRDVTFGGTRVVKAQGRFSGLWHPGLDGSLNRAALAIGHTRWATQGGRGVASASPLLAGALAGTHNGDVDAGALRARFGLRPGPNGTDSEAIFQALAAAGNAAARTEVLAAVRGRAALAWADRGRPRRVHLARAALSPLAVASDADGNLWWASNPKWLRTAERETGVSLTECRLLAEGTYAVFEARSGRVRLAASRSFTPLARPSDVRYQEPAWRGFTRADRLAGQRPGMVRHKVDHGGVPAWAAGAGGGAAA